MCDLSYNLLAEVSKMNGDTFYLLDSRLFEENYKEMLISFRKHYVNTYIAYSYKTNYTPKLCQIIDYSGGYAEIVSEMELWLALKIGVEPSKIYYNGPYKKSTDIEKLLLMGGHVNIDSQYEIDIVEELAKKYPNNLFEIGIRCNLSIGQEDVSRFGFDTISSSLGEAVKYLNGIPNVRVTGLHSHLPFRTLESFEKRVEALKEILEVFPGYHWDYISLGGGYMGKVEEKFAREFSYTPPTYEQYATVVAGELNKIFAKLGIMPKLIIEPGSALVANTVKYVTKVVNIKSVKNKYIATLSGSTYGINPSVKGITRPIEVYSGKQEKEFYENLDMAGYTCIESDYLSKNYNGRLVKGDFVVFNNVGSYSIVMKPPFILPEVPVLELGERGSVQMIRRAQKPEEVFQRFEI